MQDCHTNVTCPPKNVYGKWSNWSNCDKPCRNGFEDKVTQYRNRTCQPLNCTTGKIGNTKHVGGLSFSITNILQTVIIICDKGNIM